MNRGKLVVVTITPLFIGFAARFVLRPVIYPMRMTVEAIRSPGLARPSNEARGTQYFVAHVDEAREVVAGPPWFSPRQPMR